MNPTIGVLALQGDVREHLDVLRSLGADPISVRRPAELAACDGLVLPGGESTTMVKLAGIFDLLDPAARRRPRWAARLRDVRRDDPARRPDRGRRGRAGDRRRASHITVRRNAFGRQVDSFEEDLHLDGLADPVRAVFIRAPWVEAVDDDVEVLARVEDGPAAGRIVAVRQGPLMATSFHPEVGGDGRVHGMFVDLVRSA